MVRGPKSDVILKGVFFEILKMIFFSVNAATGTKPKKGVQSILGEHSNLVNLDELVSSTGKQQGDIFTSREAAWSREGVGWHCCSSSSDDCLIGLF